MIHSSLIDPSRLGNTRIILLFKVSILIEEPMASSISILRILSNFQALVVKENGIDVRAPTGHESIILPIDSSFK